MRRKSREIFFGRKKNANKIFRRNAQRERLTLSRRAEYIRLRRLHFPSVLTEQTVEKRNALASQRKNGEKTGRQGEPAEKKFGSTRRSGGKEIQVDGAKRQATKKAGQVSSTGLIYHSKDFTQCKTNLAIPRKTIGFPTEFLISLERR